jgi:hypothetical protein
MQDENDIKTDTGQTVDVTDAERAQINAEASADAQPAAAAAEADPTPAPAAPAPVNDDVRALAQAATEAARVAGAAVAELAASRAQPVAQAAAAPAEPDWAAKKAELKAKYDAGEIDDDQYEAAREQLIEQKADYEVERKVDTLVSKRLAKAAEQDAETRWNNALATFQANAENAKFVSDPVRAAAFNATLQVIGREMPNATYEQMLDAALNRTLEAFGQKRAPDGKEKIEAAIAQRAGAKPPAPPNIGALPSAGVPGGGDNFAQLDSLPIDDLENTLARMPADKVDAFLASAKGGLLDNPRAA